MEPERTLSRLPSDIYHEHRTVRYQNNVFHNHDGYEMFLLIEGELNYYIEQRGHHIKRGSLICIKPYDFHRREVINSDSYNRIVINIKEDKMKALSTDNTDLSACFYRRPSVIQLSEQGLCEFLEYSAKLSQGLEGEGYGSDVIAEAYLRLLLLFINKHSYHAVPVETQNIMPPLVVETVAYIDRNLSGSITLKTLSDYLSYNGIYVSRCFKKTTGLTLQEYIIGKRIALAQKYLREGKTPGEACDLTGFNNYSNFSRTFAKQVGLSPKQYQVMIFTGKMPD